MKTVVGVKNIWKTLLDTFEPFIIIRVLLMFHYFRELFKMYKHYSHKFMLLTYYKVQCPVSKYDPKEHATYELLHILLAPILTCSRTMTITIHI